jgi:hypothetical protein
VRTLAVAFLALAFAASAKAAAPRIVMIGGDVVLADWGEIIRFQNSVLLSPTAPKAVLADRPSVEVALFWNATLWEPYVQENRLDELRPEQANQFGRFYPAVDGRPPLLDLPWQGAWPKVVRGEALAILERHGVPTEVDSGTRSWLWWVIGVIAAAALVAWRLRRDALRSR